MAGSVGDGGAEVNLTPLLDLVLQLIMFFMITINFVRADQFDNGVNLPMSASAVPLENDANDYIFLNLRPTGKPPNYFELAGNLAGYGLTTPELIRGYLEKRRDDIKSHKGENQKIIIVLRADESIRYGAIWRVLDSCKRAGFEHWQLRVLTGGPKK